MVSKGPAAMLAATLAVTATLTLLPAAAGVQVASESVWGVSSVSELRQALKAVSDQATQGDQAQQFQVVVQVRPG